jgi:chromosome segregation ATPase
VTLFWWKIAAMNDDDRYIRITLRIPKDLHRDLSEVADKTSKSLNAEIIGRLTGSFAGNYLASPAAVVHADSLEERLVRQSQAAHLRVLLIGLESQVRDAMHRQARQIQLIERMRQRAEALEDSGNPKDVKSLWSELEAEEKWLAELEGELHALRAERDRLREEIEHLDTRLR